MPNNTNARGYKLPSDYFPSSKDIVENMTKGKWEPSFTEYHNDPKKIYDGVGVITITPETEATNNGKWTEKICDSILPDSDKSYIERQFNIEADMYAISNAVNETYGKRLDPCLYEDCIKLLESAHDSLTWDSEYPELKFLIKELIKNARL